MSIHRNGRNSSKFTPLVSKRQVTEHCNNIINRKCEFYSVSTSTIFVFADYSDDNRQFLANYNGLVVALAEILTMAVEIEVMEMTIAVLHMIKFDKKITPLYDLVFRNNNIDCLSSILFVLQKGKLISKIHAAKFLESMSSNAEFQLAITQKHGLVAELYNLLSSKTDQNAVNTGLSALIAVSQSRWVKAQLVQLGIVRAGLRIISDTAIENGPVIEKVMKILEMVSTCAEGQAAICKDERCVSAIVRKLMNVSVTATEHGIGVLWSVCYLSRDQTAQKAVMRSNGLTKVLLVMQSTCSGGVRQMCNDLVKVLQVKSKSWLVNYESRMTTMAPC